VGRRARDPLLESADTYLDRLKHYARAELVRVREGSMQSEAQALLAQVSPGDHVVMLDERGAMLSTQELYKQVNTWQQRSQRDVVLIIGGADGLHPDVKARANQQWSLSRFTMPHRMAQVVLLEQLYRVHTMLRGEQYHRV
jgi:23S rRNA (pseudouridine1915-N3)-methyltransferase